MSQAGAAPTTSTATVVAIYAAAAFSVSTTLMKGVAVPLWCLVLGVPPALMGVVLGARSFFPLFLSIHGGAVMDRIGVRRASIGLAVVNAVLPLLYTVFPWVGALLLFELIGGLASALLWIGAQTALARVAQGDPRHAGRFSFAANAGNLAGPLLVGVAWELAGPQAAFIVISIWGWLLLGAVLLLPVGRRAAAHQPLRLRELLPEWEMYKQALLMLKQPGVDLVVFTTFLRIAANAIQGSFYAVALVAVGQSEANIGALVAVTWLAAGAATLLSGPAARLVSQPTLLVAGIAAGIVGIVVTPSLSSFWTLAAASAVHGLGMGISLPLLLSVLSSRVPRAQQGLSVGLRATANRLAGVAIPLLLGIVIELLGITAGFYTIGAVLLVLLAVGSWLLMQRVSSG